MNFIWGRNLWNKNIKNLVDYFAQIEIHMILNQMISKKYDLDYLIKILMNIQNQKKEILKYN